MAFTVQAAQWPSVPYHGAKGTSDYAGGLGLQLRDPTERHWRARMTTRSHGCRSSIISSGHSRVHNAYRVRMFRMVFFKSRLRPQLSFLSYCNRSPFFPCRFWFWDRIQKWGIEKWLVAVLALLTFRNRDGCVASMKSIGKFEYCFPRLWTRRLQ